MSLNTFIYLPIICHTTYTNRTNKVFSSVQFWVLYTWSDVGYSFFFSKGGRKEKNKEFLVILRKSKEILKCAQEKFSTKSVGNQLEKLEAAKAAWLVLLSLTGPYLALLGLTGPYLSLTGPYWILLGLYWALLGLNKALLWFFKFVY